MQSGSGGLSVINGGEIAKGGEQMGFTPLRGMEDTYRQSVISRCVSVSSIESCRLDGDH